MAIDQATLDMLHQNYLSSIPQPSQQRSQGKQQPKAKGNFFTHLIPTIGGTGGAVEGAAIGTALLPGAGTLVGALFGGALGGGASKVGENAIEHQKLTSGVAGQAAEQGILGAGPIKLLKGATLGTKAAIGAARGGEGLAGAISAIGEKATTPLIKKQLAKTGTALQGEARGVKPGVTQTGTSQRLKPAQSDELNQYLNTLGTKNSAHTQVRAVATDLKTSGKQIGDLVAQHDRSLSIPEIALIRDKATTVAGKSLGFNARDPLVTDVEGKLSKLEKSGSLSQAKTLRDSIDTQLKSFYSKGERNTTTTTAVENVLKGYRDGLDKVLSKGIPGFRDANKRYTLGLKAQDLLLKSANPEGLRVFGIKTGIGGEGLQATKDLTGRVLKRVAGNQTEAVPGFSARAIAGRTVPIGATQAAQQTVQNTNMSQQASDTSGGFNNTPTDLTSALLAAQGGQQQSSTPYSQENLMADIQRDPRNADKYIGTYESLDKIFNPPSANKPLNSTQQQQSFNAQSGLDSLNEIASVLQQNPNAAKEASLPGGSLTANLTHTGSYQAAVNNATDVIGRLRSGGAIGQQEEVQFKKLLPAFGDNSDTINYKLNQLATLFQQFANPQASQPGGSDLTSALMQAGYGQ